MRLRSITFLLLLAVAAVGAGLEYAAGESHAKSSSSVPISSASTSDLRPSHVLATASLEASADNSHIAQIRRAHAAIRTTTIGEQPPTF